MTRRQPAAILRRATLAGAALVLAFSCARSPAPIPALGTSTVVTATAYTSHPGQTDETPFLTASGERLRPGMKVLAVSEDLFAAGLGFGTRVRIEGVAGEWVVLDRMPSGRRRSIDLWLGLDEQAALRFGRRQVRIDWGR